MARWTGRGWVGNQFTRAGRYAARGRTSRVGRVLIDELISPLRYDIEVRARFFERFGGSADDVTVMLPSLLADPYFVWFRKVRVPRRWPHLATDDNAVIEAFTEQVRRALALYDDFQAHGFDLSRPVILRTGRQILPTSTGKLVPRPAYPGNGCHRLALLDLAGHPYLEPNMYRVHHASALSPHDNTGTLLEHLAVEPAEYLRFLSIGYGVDAAKSTHELVERVNDRDPRRVEELLQVIATDEPKLASTYRSDDPR